jgi:hypothetical protein
VDALLAKAESSAFHHDKPRRVERVFARAKRARQLRDATTSGTTGQA